MDRPILFSAPMVRAILDGRKTMTRRIDKPKFDKWQVGDRLWVRETYVPYHPEKNEGMEDFDTDVLKVAYRATTPDFCGDCFDAKSRQELDEQGYVSRWKPSIFMPRKYSRILLEITELKRERLQDISEADAKREGVNKEFRVYIATFIHGSENAITKNESYKLGFRSIWEQINGRESWEQNPKVVAIGFKVLETKGGAK